MVTYIAGTGAASGTFTKRLDNEYVVVSRQEVFDGCQDCYTVTEVVGRGLPDDEVVAAAAAVVAGPGGVGLIAPRAVPRGLQPLLLGGVPAGAGLGSASWSNRLTGAGLGLEVVRGGERLALLYRSGIQGRSVTVHGAPGFVGRSLELRDVADRHDWTWWDGETVVSVGASGMPAEEVERFVDDLRPVDARRWAELRASVANYPPRWAFDKYSSLTTTVKLDVGMWALAVTKDPGVPNNTEPKEMVVHADHHDVLGPDSGVPAVTRNSTGLTVTWRDFPSGSLITGSVQRRDASVRLLLAGDRRRALPQPLPGPRNLHWFGTWQLGPNSGQAVEAVTSDGHVVARVTR